MLVGLLAIICVTIFALTTTIHTIFKADKEIDASALESKKFSYMFKVMNQWMQALHEGKSMERYLMDNGYENIAIYGMFYIGERLFEELSASKLTVVYAIDKNREVSNFNIKIFKPTDELPPVDLVVVTTALYFYDIKRQIKEKLECPIISIEELVERME